METKERVIKLLADKLGISKTEIKEEHELVNDLGMDSLDVVESLMEVEHEFGLRIDDLEAQKIKTVGDLVKKIEEKRMGR